MRIHDGTTLPADSSQHKYGKDVSADSVEWILKPAATICKDVCTGFSLRKLTDADRKASLLARC